MSAGEEIREVTELGTVVTAVRLPSSGEMHESVGEWMVQVGDLPASLRYLSDGALEKTGRTAGSFFIGEGRLVDHYVTIYGADVLKGVSVRNPRKEADIAARAGLTVELAHDVLRALLAVGKVSERERGFVAVSA